MTFKLLGLRQQQTYADLRYHSRVAPLDVDSGTGQVRVMMFCTATPGHYIGLGRVVVPSTKYQSTIDANSGLCYCALRC